MKKNLKIIFKICYCKSKNKIVAEWMYMQDIKIKNYKRLILSVFIGASLISIMQVTILQVLLTCFICFVVFDFLKKRKQNELGKCNHFVIECVIVTSFALSEILGNFIGIYNVHTCNFFGLGIALLCVILEGVFLFKE